MYGFSLGIKYQVKSELTVFPLCPLTHLVHSTVTKKTEQTPKPKPTSDYWWFFTSFTKLELQKDASHRKHGTFSRRNFAFWASWGHPQQLQLHQLQTGALCWDEI